MSAPRFLQDQGLLASLANLDSSFGQCAVDARLAVYIDYRRGRPMSVQVVRIPSGMSFKLHLNGTESA